MKQFFILLLIALLVAPAGFAQTGKKARVIAPLIADEQIRHIILAGNIDVLLTEDIPSQVGVKVPVSSLELLDIRIEGDRLYISASRKLEKGERGRAYVTVSDLNSLELKGNVVVTSKGVLESKELNVTTNEMAVLALRLGGPVKVTSPISYMVTKEKEYYSVFAGRL